MKKIDTALRILTAILIAILCLLSAAFASSEEVASASDAIEETPVTVVYEYEITISPPSGWHTASADAKVAIRDVYNTGWDGAVLICPGAGGTKAIDGASAAIPVSENGTYTVRVTDPVGGVHEVSETIACFDTTAPAVTAGIRDKVLHAEASDSQSGVYGILVDGNLYTTLQDGALDLRLEDYSDAGKTLSITAIDNAGNRSALTAIDNPYYVASTPAPASTHAPVIIYTGAETGSSSGSTGSVPSSSTVTATPVAQTSVTPVASTTAAATGAASSTATPAPTKAPDTTADEPVESEPEEITIEPGTGFSQNGNAVTRDLLYDKFSNKQFITVQTRNGNIMYLVIDYDKVSDEDEEQYQTYFLNPVDEADLLALLDDDAISALTGSAETPEETPAVCTCDDKCVVGHIDTTCPVCRTDVSKCIGTETVTPTPEPTPDPEDEPEPEPAGSKAGGILVVFVILGLIGGGVFYFVRNRKDKPQTAGSTEFDDYDFGEDEEDEIEEDTEGEEASAHDRSYHHD